MIKILLVDAEPYIRRGLRMHLALEPDFAVVGEASNGWDALRWARELQPHVVVLDIRLPDLDGLSVAARLRQSQPRCAVIILTLYDEPANRARAAHLGVTAFLLKGGSADELKQAIRQTTVTKGERS